MSVVYELENRGKRSFIIGTKDHISGGEVKSDPTGKPINVYFNEGKTVKVTETCGKKLSEGWPNEIRVVKKTNRKE